jgi:hypothetical protein
MVIDERAIKNMSRIIKFNTEDHFIQHMNIANIYNTNN